MCVLLAGSGPLQAQGLKTRLADHYDERIDPSTFYKALEALEETGHVEARTEGIHDVYGLTTAGLRRLEAHRNWMQAQLE